MVQVRKLSNGLTLIIEEIANAESAAYELVIPGGVITDAEGQVGGSLVLGEMTTRGAGPYDSKSLSDAFDDQGIRHGETGGYDRFSYRGALLPDKLPRALTLVAHMVREPRLPADEIESIQSLLLQDIRALDDNPSKKAMLELANRYYPAPYGRPSMGTDKGISGATVDSLRAEWERSFRPSRAILSIAGKVSSDSVIKLVEDLFGTWEGTGVTLPPFGKLPSHSTFHIHQEAAQLQIALSYPSAKFGDKHYYTAKVALGILSGGMFGRLFIEVREKRGLCYSVYARHSATTSFGTVTAYAGTTPERAHDTLQVMMTELRRLKGTVTPEEISRAKANIKASLIISEESVGSRASSNASDYFLNGEIRSLDQISREIDAVTVKDIDSFCDQYPADSVMLVTLGSRELEVPKV